MAALVVPVLCILLFLCGRSVSFVLETVDISAKREVEITENQTEIALSNMTDLTTDTPYVLNGTRISSIFSYELNSTPDGIKEELNSITSSPALNMTTYAPEGALLHDTVISETNFIAEQLQLTDMSKVSSLSSSTAGDVGLENKPAASDPMTVTTATVTTNPQTETTTTAPTETVTLSETEIILRKLANEILIKLFDKFVLKAAAVNSPRATTTETLTSVQTTTYPLLSRRQNWPITNPRRYYGRRTEFEGFEETGYYRPEMEA